MIFDTLQNTNRYKNIPQLGLIPSVLEKLEKGEIPEGKSKIEGSDNCWVIHLNYETKEAEEGLWEAHEKFLDVHVIASGKEVIHLSDIENMKSNMEYDAENDYWLFDGSKSDDLILSTSQFLVLYPNEVHKTSVVINEPEEVKKLVFKFPI